MRTTRSVVLLVTLAIIGLTVAPVTSGVVASTFAATDSEGSQSASTNASVGTTMQASAADASNAIESELFETAYERADNETRATLVSDRTAELEAKVAALENERAQLEANRDQLSRGAYRSQLSRLTVQLAGLERSIDRTERRAEEVNVAEDRLASLHQDVTAIRQNTSTQAGPGVAAVARGVAGKGPDATGPPTDSGLDTTQSPGDGPDDRPSKADSTDQRSDRSGDTQSAETPADRSSENTDDGASTENSNDDASTENSNDDASTGSGPPQGANADK
ncbi:hypothetical protein ACFR99_09700 [Haloarchaeobius amylolyticus]|uniref:Uncharacterized protein n=1 Tax=Haloarchaeobius amylolyticus TaxID=1198296 RepID=A0ABD6BH08_9EURY